MRAELNEIVSPETFRRIEAAFEKKNLENFRYRDLKSRGIVDSRATLARWIQAGDFPPGILIGPNIRVWPAAQIDAFLRTRPTAAKAAPRRKAARVASQALAP
ncbi:helix-turn-helix transcriptional regulator [Methylocapsa palsarum]|uniref:helix-turn-helix transcriptional regulator n=1 Tax=Methylocapsa palsarum TaxID=1612308 RepID=UPI001113D02F|nr:AlpA family phage regulatory protein [Methylocapsa palsarum]